MSEIVTRMTSNTFTMRLVFEDKTALEVNITGKGFAFDRDSGALLRGTVDSIALTNLTQQGRRFDLVESHKLGGLNLPVEKLAEVTGAQFWNHVKHVVEMFGKLSHLHEGVSRSFFSPHKNVAEGSELNDNLVGSARADIMMGNAGNDNLNAAGGDDLLNGGKGNDLLNGGNGNDFLIDEQGHNNLNGGAGNDRMLGGQGNDRLSGSTGRDIMYGSGGVDRLSGGRDADVFVFNSKEASRITVTDFERGDLLVNLATGGAEESFKYFLDGARQVGKDVVYQADGLHLTLKNFKLDAIGMGNFTDAGVVKEAGLLF
jgi:hypothetical protein